MIQYSNFPLRISRFILVYRMPLAKIFQAVDDTFISDENADIEFSIAGMSRLSVHQLY